MSIIDIQNPWWKNPAWETEGVRRILFNQILKELDTKNIVVIKGPRQSGKTFLIKQVISYLLESGKNPMDIVYLSFDDRRLREITEKGNLFAMLQELKAGRKERMFVFIDEFQKADVAETVKILAEAGNHYKFILSGSSSLAISEKVSESLLGRTRTFYLFPFSYQEFLKANGIDTSRLIPLTDQLKDFFITPNEKGYEEIKAFFQENRLLFSDIEERLNSFLLIGGYPKAAQAGLPNDSFIVLQEILNAYLEKDILSETKIDKIKEYRHLMEYLANNPGGIINIFALSQDLKINQATVKKFINILEHTYIVMSLSVFINNRISSLKKSQRIIFYDNGLRNYLAQTMDSSLLAKEKGIALEGLVSSSLIKMNYYYFNGFLKLYYWRNIDKNEVDYILSSKNTVVPIEVKNSVELKRGYKTFVEKMGLKHALTITSKDFNLIRDGSRNFYFLPASIMAGI